MLTLNNEVFLYMEKIPLLENTMQSNRHCNKRQKGGASVGQEGTTRC